MVISCCVRGKRLGPLPMAMRILLLAGKVICGNPTAMHALTAGSWWSRLPSSLPQRQRIIYENAIGNKIADKKLHIKKPCETIAFCFTGPFNVRLKLLNELFNGLFIGCNINGFLIFVNHPSGLGTVRFMHMFFQGIINRHKSGMLAFTEVSG